MAEKQRDFDAAAATWDATPYRVRLADDVNRCLKEKIRLSRDMDVLEVGCGTGLLTLLLQPQVKTITAIDSSGGMLDVLDQKLREKRIGNVTTRRMNIETAEDWGGPYDLVVSSMTLHHISDVSRLLHTLSSVLRPGGYFCIADLDAECGMFHRRGEFVPHKGFDRALLKREFGRAGLHTIRNYTAAMPVKPDCDGELRCFTVFLMAGQK
jgi:2-polyprenyl-3-methyl-5-hydroxy-6-metoxy-1,4-benzoquinol methylase